MPIQKIKFLIDSLPKSHSELITEVNANDHFELARRLHQLSPEGKFHVFSCLNSNLKRQEVLSETLALHQAMHLFTSSIFCSRSSFEALSLND